MNKIACNLFIIIILLFASCKDNDATKSDDTKLNHTDILEKKKKIETVKANGYGDSREQAIYHALKVAREQVYGLRITKDSFSSSNKMEISVYQENALGIKQDVSISTEKNTEPYHTKGGDILSYEILSETQNGKGQWSVSVKAQLYAPQDDAFADKISLVISPIEEIDLKLMQLGFPKEVTNNIGQSLYDSFSSLFSNTNEFVILNRHDEVSLRERQMIKNEDTASLDKLKVGNIKVADFALSITGERGHFTINEQRYPSTGQVVYRGQWELFLTVKMIDVSSDAIVTTVSTSLSGKSNAFTKEKCLTDSLKEIQNQLIQKTSEAGGQLAFNLGFPLLREGKLQSKIDNSFHYQFSLHGPHLLYMNQRVMIYRETSRGKEKITDAIIVAYDRNANTVSLKTEKELLLEPESSQYCLAPNIADSE